MSASERRSRDAANRQEFKKYVEDVEAGLSPDERATLDTFRAHYASRKGWRPDWTLPPAPKGDDEDEVKALYYREAGVDAGLSWRQLQEWQRESWRREYRDD